MSGSWAEVRRADRAAEREQARLDADARSARRLQEQRELVDLAMVSRERRRDDRATSRAAAAGWVGSRAVELLVYPLALVSAVMAVPAMAVYGEHVYGSVTGIVLPALSELGMWAFALAVLVARRSDPPRPVGRLQAGVVVFAAVGFALNFLHGLSHGATNAVVMGVVSVAGVVAHQLVVAAPPRARRDRLTRVADRRVAKARRAAARAAVVELDADGTARLVHTPGLYVPRRRRLDPVGQPEDALPATAEGDTASRGALPTDAAGPLPERFPEALPAATPKALPVGASHSQPGSGPAPRRKPAAGRSPGRGARTGEETTALAVELERAALADTGRGLSYRAAQQALGVRYADARAALDTARARLAEQAPTDPEAVDAVDLDAPAAHPTDDLDDAAVDAGELEMAGVSS